MRFTDSTPSRIFVLTAFVALAAGMPVVAHAQYPPVPERGPQARVQLADGSGWVTGRMEAKQLIATDGKTLSLNDATVSRIQVNHTTSHAGVGAVIGGVAGAALFVGLANSTEASTPVYPLLGTSPTMHIHSDTGAVVGFAVVGGLLGAVAGGVVGHLITVDHWVDAPVPSVDMGMSATSGAVEVGLTWPTSAR